MQSVSSHSDKDPNAITVVICDDVAIIRSLIKRALEGESDIEVVATAANGKTGIDAARNYQPDFMILDIEMPIMDGLEALPEIKAVSPNTQVLMASTLTLRNAEISLKAIALGATDYLPKPESQGNPDANDEFYAALKQKLRALKKPSRPGQTAKTLREVPKAPAASAPVAAPPRSPVLNPLGIKALAVASSTGGPPALSEFFPAIAPYIKNIPVFLTQHMPAKFTTILAQHIQRDTGVICFEPEMGTIAEPNTIYIAPGGFHMVPKKNMDGATQITLNEEPPINFCRPAADPMITALSDIYGAGLLVVVLTGMGNDGAEGAKYAYAKGATVLAQDEESSVVYGMPKAVADAGIAEKILPLNQLPSAIGQIIGK